MAPSIRGSTAEDLDGAELPFATLRCDIHTHILPPRLASRIRSYFEASGMVRCCPPPASPTDVAVPSPSSSQPTRELMYPIEATPLVAQLFAELAAPSSRKPSPSALRKALLRPGKTGPYNGARPLHLVTLPYAHKGDMSIHLNREVFRLAQSLTRDELWNNRLLVTPGFTVHPEDRSPAPVDVVADALGRGGKVMKLHCSVGQLTVLDERLDKVWKVAEETGFPTVVHFGTSVFGTTEDAELAELDTFVERYPKAKIIIAHFGHPATEKALSLARHPSVYFDLTPVVVDPVSLPPPSSAPAATILSLALSGRILFGSDVPNVAITVSDSVRRIQLWIHAAARASQKEGWREEAERATDEVLGLAAERLLDLVQARRYWKDPEAEEVGEMERSGVQVPRSML